MQKGYEDNFKEFFLLEFTKCLIEESINIGDVVKFDDNKRGKVNKKTIKSIMSELSVKKKELSREADVIRKNRVVGILSNQVKKIAKKVSSRNPLSRKAFPKNVVGRPIVRGRLVINEPQFSQRLRYIRPVRTSQIVDLGKLNSLLVSPMVKQIDCNGAGKEIVVRTNHSKKTNVTLTEDEIFGIVKNFSILSRIPVEEGVFRAAAGNVELVAMVSETVGTKFIIRKIASPGVNRFR